MHHVRREICHGGPGCSQQSPPRRPNSMVSSQPELPPETAVKSKQWLQNSEPLSWWLYPQCTELRKKNHHKDSGAKSKQPGQQRGYWGSVHGLFHCHRGQGQQAVVAKPCQKCAQAGRLFSSPASPDPVAGTKAPVSSRSCLSMNDLAQFCPQRADTANLAFICQALLRPCSNLSILGSQG